MPETLVMQREGETMEVGGRLENESQSSVGMLFVT